MSVVCSDERPADERELLPIEIDRWRDLAAAVLAEEGAEGELTLTFVGQREIADLNLEHMGKGGPTDVLSFPLDASALDASALDASPPDASPHDASPPEGAAPDVPTLLGDVVVSPAVAADQCATHAGTLDDELALLVVHGILHVLGHDHLGADDAAVMRGRESELLRRLHWRGAQPVGFRHDHLG